MFKKYFHVNVRKTLPECHMDSDDYWLVFRSATLMCLWVHLNDGGGSPGRGVGVELRHVGHAGQRAQSVHLAHRHGNGGRRQAGRNQRMWHHHEGQLIQNWSRIQKNKIEMEWERAQWCPTFMAKVRCSRSKGRTSSSFLFPSAVPDLLDSVQWCVLSWKCIWTQTSFLLWNITWRVVLCC